MTVSELLETLERGKHIFVYKNVGESISYRDIRKPNIQCHTVVNGFGVDEDNRLQYIELGTLRITPKDLLEKYEYRDYGEWKKFGKHRK